jgi:alkylhydroperoxidase/carboxymuconolactone decarboxylase family protein YurZ
MAVDTFDETLRRLVVGDTRFLSELSVEAANTAASSLEPKTHALVQIAALTNLEAAPQSYTPCVEAARLAGASDEEIVGTLLAAIPIVGAPRVVSAARSLGLALGYDLDAALEAEDLPTA